MIRPSGQAVAVRQGTPASYPTTLLSRGPVYSAAQFVQSRGAFRCMGSKKDFDVAAYDSERLKLDDQVCLVNGMDPSLSSR